jgi:hypothetical protein
MRGEAAEATNIDLRPRPAPGRVAIALMVTGAATFLGTFEENPHCTQRVSFATAVFETEHHPEDKGWDGPPLVYQPALGWPIRGVLGLLVLAALFRPAIVVLACRESRGMLRTGILVQMGVAASPAVVSLLPREVIGERFQELLRATSLCATLLVPVSLLAVFRIRRWRVRAQAMLEGAISGLDAGHAKHSSAEPGPVPVRPEP